jgi:hypothetical protein
MPASHLSRESPKRTCLGRVGVQSVVGGMNVNAEVKRFARDRADILIAVSG